MSMSETFYKNGAEAWKELKDVHDAITEASKEKNEEKLIEAHNKLQKMGEKNYETQKKLREAKEQVELEMKRRGMLPDHK